MEQILKYTVHGRREALKEIISKNVEQEQIKRPNT